MEYLSKEHAEELMDKAKYASECTYSPYSKFAVGAAILTESGNVYLGTNIENISYTGTVHAEKIAVGNAQMSKDTEFKAIAVYANVGDISPCGDCRQFLVEFKKNIIVIFKHEGNIIQKKLSDLLPYHFKDLN
jgi:cytidine deaminase